jgi:hypothetical protein
MAHPHNPDGGDGLQIWKIAENMLNKQLWTADKGWGLTPYHKNQCVMKCYTEIDKEHGIS